MSFSRREQLKVKAALAEMHSAGHDTAEVTDLAARLIGMGTPERQAYDRAFSGFVARVPAFQAALQRVGQLVDASDNPTVARYNVALSNFISTGDRSHIDAITPVLQQDLAELASRTGDAGLVENITDTPATELGAPRPGHGPTGYSVKATKAQFGALPPTGPAQREGWGHTGYSPGSAKPQAEPSE